MSGSDADSEAEDRPEREAERPMPAATQLRRSQRAGRSQLHRYSMVDYTKDVGTGGSVNHVDAERDREKCRDDAQKNQELSPDRPPIKNGQVKMPTQRCTAD